MIYTASNKAGSNRKPRYPTALTFPAPLIAALYQQAAETGQSVTDLAAIALERGLSIPPAQSSRLIAA
jgi:hypothetical protein